MSDKIPASAYIVLFGAQLAVGAAAIFARFALHGTGPLAASALRLTIAAVPLILPAWRAGRPLVVPARHEALLVFAGFALAAHFATWIGSLLYTTVAASTLLVSTTPAWTALYDGIVLKHRKGAGFWAAMTLAAIGIVLIAASRSSAAAPVAGRVLLGDLLAVCGSVAIAAYLIAIRAIAGRYPTRVIVGRTYTWAALMLLAAVLVTRQPLPGRDMTSWGGIIGMALVSQLVGHTAINASLRWFASTAVAFSTLLEPIVAAALAAWIFSERLSPQVAVGGALTLVALTVVLRDQRRA